ncbi:MAG: CopG family transcriptional regulator [Thermoprotei archaeon]|nr:MAG: CopG family transcriptional regulator [Thermoprotei archaeon]
MGKAMRKKERKWVWISVPIAMLKLIDRAIEEHPEYGYRSRNEFVEDAVRRKLRELGVLR